MSRILRRNPPRLRSAPFTYVDLTSDCDSENDSPDENPEDRSDPDHPDQNSDEEECAELTLLREALFLEAQYITSDEDEESQEEGGANERLDDPPDDDHPDQNPDEEECPELTLLREAMYLEAAYITSDEDEGQEDEA